VARRDLGAQRELELADPALTQIAYTTPANSVANVTRPPVDAAFSPV
jgi:hypothetical protein